MSEQMTPSSHQEFVSTKEASAMTGYVPDYIARLCREGKIDARQVGRAWVINAASLFEFVQQNRLEKQEKAKKLAEERELEYRAAQHIDAEPLARAVPTPYPTEEPLAPSAPVRGSFAALAVTLLLVTGALYGTQKDVQASTARFIVDSSRLSQAIAGDFQVIGLTMARSASDALASAGAAHVASSAPAPRVVTIIAIDPDHPASTTHLIYTENGSGSLKKTEEARPRPQNRVSADAAKIPAAEEDASIARQPSAFVDEAFALLRAPIAFGDFLIRITHGILDAYQDVAYGYARGSAEVPAHVIAAVYDVGESVAVAATEVPHATGGAYDLALGAVGHVALAYDDIRSTLASAYDASLVPSQPAPAVSASAPKEETHPAPSRVLPVAPSARLAASISLSPIQEAGESAATFVYETINSLFGHVASVIAPRPAPRPFVINAIEPPAPAPGPAIAPATSTSVTYAPASNVQNSYYTLSVTGVSPEYVDQRIATALANFLDRPRDRRTTSTGTVDLSSIDGSTITNSTFEGSNVTTDTLTLGTLNGPLQANHGVVSATSSIGVLYGGTGLTVAPTYGQVLLGNGSGGYDLVATSSLGITGGGGGSFAFTYPLVDTLGTVSLAFGTTTANSWSAHNTFASLFALNASSTNATTSALGVNGETFTDLTGTGLSNVGGALTLNATGDWTGTFDSHEGSFYLDRANHTGTQTASTISDFSAAVNAFIHASTTIPKTYTANTFTGANTFSGGLTIGSLSGILKAAAGVVSTATPGTDFENPLAFTYPLVRSVNSISLGFGTTTANSWSALQQFGNASTTQLTASGNVYLSNLADGCLELSGGIITSIGSNCGSGGGGITSFGAAGQAQTGSSQTLATSTGSFNGLTLGTTIVSSGNSHLFTPTITGTLDNAGLTNSSISLGGVSISLGGTNATPAFDLTSATNLPIVSGTTGTLTAARGGTGWANIQSNALLLGNGTGALATTTAGTDGQVLALVSGVPTWQATTTLSTIGGTLGVNKGGTATTTWMNGAVVFYDSVLGALSQATTQAGFFFDKTTSRLGLGTSNPSETLQVAGNAIIGDSIVGSSYTTAPLALVNSAVGTLKTQLNLVNTGGGPGAGSAIDFYTYTTTGNGLPEARIGSIDDGNYSAGISFFTKAPGDFGGNGLIERLTIDTGGNVGVGTTSPYAKLAVGGSVVVGAPTAGGTLGDLYLPKLGTAAGTFLAVDPSGKVIATTTPSGGGGSGTVNSGTAGFFGYYPSTGTTIDGQSVLFTDGTNIGIGTTSPYAKLSVVGQTVSEFFTATSTTATSTLPELAATHFTLGSLNGILKATAGSVTSALVNLASDITGTLGIANGGTGTSTPGVLGDLLAWNGTNWQGTATSTLGLPTFGDIASSLAGYFSLADWYATTTDALAQGSANLYSQWENVTGGINFAAGNVGIGTASPNYPLEVVGTSAFTGAMTVGGYDSRGMLTVQQTDDSTVYSPDSDPGDSGRYFVMENTSTLDTAGQYAAVTLQVNPTGTLGSGRVLGDLRLARDADGSSNSSFYLSAFRDDGYHDYAKLGYDTSWFSGNVGIGTTSPYAKLSVVGETVSEYFTATSTTATSTLPELAAAHFTLGSLTGVLKAAAGAVMTGFVNLASEVTGTLGIANGGTGTSTPGLLGDVLSWNGTNWQGRATSTLGVSLSDTTGTLTVPRGGTGATSFTDNRLLTGNGTGALVDEANLTFDGSTLSVNSTIRVDSAGDTGFQFYENGSPRWIASYSVAGDYFYYRDVQNSRDHLQFYDSGKTVFPAIAGNVGIGTTSPYAKLSVVGDVVAANFTATTTQTSTFPNASTTNLTVDGNLYTPSIADGCAAIASGILTSTGVDCGTGSGGITSLGAAGQAQVGASQTLATTTGSFNGLTLGVTIVSSSNSHQFTPSITGTLDNAGLTNSSISLGGVSISLGGTNATPAFNLASATGLPVSTGLSGLGTGVATALAVNTGSSGAFVVNGGALGTPSSGTLTNATGLPIAGITGLGTGVGTALAVNTGSAGAFVVNGGALGTPSSGTLTNATGLPLTSGVTGTLPVANGGTGWANIQSNALLLGNGTGALATTTAGTDGQVLALVSGVPTWQATTTLSTISGTLGVANGGTGATSLTSSQLIYGAGTGAVQSVATSSLAVGSEFTYGGTLGALVGGVGGTLTLTGNGVTLGKLATIAANSILGNPTGSTGNVQAIATSSLGIALGDTTGTLQMNRGGTGATSFTQGSVIFSNGTTLAQNNSDFFWSTINSFLGLGTSSPQSRLAVSGGATVGADYNVAAPTNGLLVEGKVGIGTTTPASLLNIKAPINDGGGSYTNGILFTTNNNEAAGIWPDQVAGGLGALVFGTNNTGTGGTPAERLRILPSGAVGIGTSTPSRTLDVWGSFRARVGTDQKLDVTGQVTLSDGVAIRSLNDADSAYKSLEIAASQLVINATGGTGNVGIGTTSPAQLLAVGGNVIIGASSAGGTNGTLTYGGVTLANSVTGTGSMVLSSSPTLSSPNLGTPTTLTLTNATGLPISGITGLGTDVGTALAVNVGSAGAFVVNGGALGTPSSGTLTNATGLPIVGGTTGTLTVARGGTGATTFTGGLLVGNGTNAFITRTLTAPAAGISVSNGDGVSGNPTLALANDLAALEGLSGTGIAVRTAADTWANRTIAGTTNRLTVTNGDGVSGNPTLDISSSYVGQSSITTLGTITSGTWNGTTIAVANGGTGATSLNDLITLGTHTTGNYVATITGSGTITSSGATSGEGIAHTLSVTADSIGDTQLAFNTGQHLTTASAPSFAGLTVTNALTQSGGFARLGSFNTQTRPSAGSDLAIAWNYSSGTGEVDLWNTYTSAGGFTFKQLTGASSHTDVLTIGATGTLTTASTLTVSANGAAITGNSTIAGTLGSLTGLTSSGTITFSGLTAGRNVCTTTGGQLTVSCASADLANSLTDETGSGSAVFASSPALTTPSVSGNLTLSTANAYISNSSWVGFSQGIYAAGGTSYFQTQTIFRGGISDDTNANLTIYGGTSGKTNFNGDVLVGGGTGKITIGTVDPVYTIDGTSYATYMSGMIGVKEEMVGTADITTPITAPDGTQGYASVLSFDDQETGSDLWLFARTTNLHEQIDRLVVLLSAEGGGKVWYTIDRANHKVYLLANQPTRVSYRLTAPRFDAAHWTNYNHDGVVGFTPPSPTTDLSIFGDSETQFSFDPASLLSGTTTLAALTGGSTSSAKPWNGGLSGISQGLRGAMSSLTSSVVHAFAGAQYFADGIFKRIFAGEVHTDKICVSNEGGETCLTRTELDALLAGAASANTISSGGTSGGAGNGGTPDAGTSTPAEGDAGTGGDSGATPGDTGSDSGAGDTGNDTQAPAGNEAPPTDAGTDAPPGDGAGDQAPTDPGTPDSGTPADAGGDAGTSGG